MKKCQYITLLLVIVAGSTGCKKAFLDRIPQSALSNETYWNSETDLRTYNNGIYNEAGNNGLYTFMLGYTNDPWTSGYEGEFWEDCKSDNMAPLDANLNKYAIIASGQYIVPANPDQGGWHWGLLRRINFFLENYQRVIASESIKEAYAGEARMFRAWFYFDKVKRFGDVPWVGRTLNINSDELYSAREPRSKIMDSVLADINFAVDHLPNDWGATNPNRLTRGAALALKARICLHEGTFRKYHQLAEGGVEQWLTEAADAADKLITEGRYALYFTGDIENNYNQLFRQVDLTGNKEVIFFRKYVDGVNGHRFCGYESRRPTGITRDFAEDYLCTDGKPIQLSPLYEGDINLKTEFKQRDPRFRQTVLHPQDSLKYTGYRLPYPRFLGMGGYMTSTGYTPIKFYDIAEELRGYGKEQNDAIIFRLGEALLVYAEAKAELGTLTQGDLDRSVNKLRDRVGMPHLTLDPPMDPKYADQGLSSILVEIRRERRVELAVEGFRYDDLMRWAKGANLAKRVLGMRFEDSEAANFPDAQVKTITINGKKYIDVYQGSLFENRVFDPNKHYYFPVAIGVISMNPAIKQNPGWNP